MLVMGRKSKRAREEAYCDLGVGSPVGRRHLIGEPGCDGLGGAGAVLGHRLDDEVHAVQDPLGCILVVGGEQLGLRGRGEV